MAAVFLKEEKNYYKKLYNTLCLGSVNRQKSRWKVFLKGAWHLKVKFLLLLVIKIFSFSLVEKFHRDLKIKKQN